MAYGSDAEAKEAVGGHARTTLQWDLSDPQINAPTDLSQGTTGDTVTLYLCSGERLIRDRTAVTFLGTEYYEPLVKSWGPITEQAYVGEGYATSTDTQIVLHNRRMQFQMENSAYTFASGAGAESPEAAGDEVALSQLFQFYNPVGSDLTIRVVFYDTEDVDQSGGGPRDIIIYKGTVYDVRITPQEVVLDITQDRSELELPMPGRMLTDSYDKQTQTVRAPIVYGDSHTSVQTNSITPWQATVANLVVPPLAPAKAHTLETTQDRWRLIYNDVKGRNQDNDIYDGQAVFTAGDGQSNANDFAILYNPNTAGGVYSRLIKTASSEDGKIEWRPQSGTAEELQLRAVQYLQPTVYLPLSATLEATGVTDFENVFGPSPFTYATLDLGSTSNEWVMSISPVETPPGAFPRQGNNLMRAWIVVEDNTADWGGSPEAHFGLYSYNLNDPTQDHYIGTYRWPDFSTAYSVVGKLNSTTLTANALYDQTDDQTDVIHQDVYWLSNLDVAANNWLTRWEWRFPLTWDVTVPSEVVWRIHVATASGGDSLRIISAGVAAEYEIGKPTPFSPLP